MRILIRLLAAVVLVAAFLGYLDRREDPGPASDDACGDPAGACTDPNRLAVPGAVNGGAGAAAFPVDSLEAARVCPGAGYLCAGLEERGEWRIARWDEDTPMIRVRIPLPPVEDRGLARTLQRAAARGIRTWQGHPFPLRVDLGEGNAGHDVTIRWTLAPGGRELGHASTRWRRSGGEVTVEVQDFALAVRDPTDPARALSAGQIELTAAHEMGHALGLPHSDREEDVMYPANTATRLTSRDFRTMEALYRLGNGAHIVRP